MSADELDLVAPIATPTARRALWDEMFDTLRQGEKPDARLRAKFLWLMWLIQEQPEIAREFATGPRVKQAHRRLEDWLLVGAAKLEPPEPGSYEAKKQRAALRRTGTEPPRKRGRPPSRKK